MYEISVYEGGAMSTNLQCIGFFGTKKTIHFKIVDSRLPTDSLYAYFNHVIRYLGTRFLSKRISTLQVFTVSYYGKKIKHMTLITSSTLCHILILWKVKFAEYWFIYSKSYNDSNKNINACLPMMHINLWACGVNDKECSIA